MSIILAGLNAVRISVLIKTCCSLITMALLCLTQVANAQNFTSNANGVWTTGSNWVGGTAPPTAGQNWGITRVNHELTINGGYDFQANTVVAGVKYGLEIAAGKTLRVNGNFSISNGAVVNVYGTLNITGSASLNAELFIYPGGKVIIGTNLTVINSTYLTVGTNVTPGSYADLVIKQNLISQNSGDIVINQNGRVVVYKNFTSDTNGGTLLTINSGGQIYINGNIALAGGGDNVTNSNGTTPIGFYVNGTSTASGGGATIDTNMGTKSTMFTNDKPFYDWVAAQAGSPLPIALISFKIEKIGDNSVILNWATASEQNFDYFSVEQSSNGINFESIGKVDGAGSSKVVLNYSYLDQKPFVGKNYYRLKSIDKDGSYEYSKVVFIEFESVKKMTIYPNPSKGDFINYSINFDPIVNDKIVVINSAGVEIETFNIEMNSGEIAFNKTLESGTYLVKYSSTYSHDIAKLIVK